MSNNEFPLPINQATIEFLARMLMKDEVLVEKIIEERNCGFREALELKNRIYFAANPQLERPLTYKYIR